MMTVHVLHAGDGYSYLTRQVAAADHNLARGQDLTDYYTAEGAPAGRWVGSGTAVLEVDGDVAETQMRALFGEGLHPDADATIARELAAGGNPDDAIAATRLGRRFMVPTLTDDGWDDAIRAAYAQFRTDNARSPEVGAERDLIRLTLATERATTLLGRPAADAEVQRFLADRGRAQRLPVAGYDLVFTPVKSVSVLWALADKGTSEEIHRAHTAAWRGTLDWIESEAALTRVGAAGVGQINTNGLTAAAFDHRDSRTGDPNLHTHVAISTKVQGIDGKWRSLDGRVLHQLGVAASERYNTLIEHELRRRLGVSFEPESRGRNKRAVREIVGVPRELRDAFSSRRAAIEDAYNDLVKEYVRANGHTPSKPVQLKLAQQATLTTREGKDQPNSLDEQRAQWRQSAMQTVGERRLGLLLDDVRRPLQKDDRQRTRDAKLAAMTPDDMAAAIIERVENDRSTWRRAHLEAEAQRLARAVVNARSDGADLDVIALAADITDRAAAAVIRVTAPDLNPVPDALQREDGESIYHVHGTDTFTSSRILDIEDRLITAGNTTAGVYVPAKVFEATLADINATREHPLDAGQAELARAFATGGKRIQVGIGPAGTGKTTAMKVFARAAERAGARILALAPTAAASTVLADEIDVEADTAHKLIQIHTSGSTNQQESDQYRVDAHTILLIDEAGMASTPLLAEVLNLAERKGASIRLLGDPAQLAAVESGGALRLLERETEASYLDTVWRFRDKTEAAATLRLRVGDDAALGFYVDHDRTRGGLRQSMLEDIYVAWSGDRDLGRNAIMVAGTNEEVAALNTRARVDLVAQNVVESAGLALHDGNRAGIGDLVVTRRNDRRLRSNRGRDFVANGDTWTVLARTTGGELKVKSLRHDGVLTLPAEYVRDHVELAYASTINRVQGMTVDRAHILVDPEATSREQLYVAATRGRDTNHLYAVISHLGDVDAHATEKPSDSIVHALQRVLARESAELSAHETIQRGLDHAASLAGLLPSYEDAIIRARDPEQTIRMEQLVRETLPAAPAEQVIADEAWPSLAIRLAEHEAKGNDPAALLTDAAAPHRMDNHDEIRSLAKILHFRVGSPRTTDVHDLPEWISAAPTESGPNEEVRLWSNRQADLIADRIHYLVDRTILEPPEWTAQLSLEDLTDAQRRDLGSVLAYRDLHQVGPHVYALGAPPTYAADSYVAALNAYRRLTAATHDFDRDTAAQAQPAHRTQRVTVAEDVRTRLAELRQSDERLRKQDTTDHPDRGQLRLDQNVPTQ
ncbi:MobF family relaxase [Rathayibacter rathayi]|nr:MobF family relaxase [Rathayibacter rathayi]MWV75897.1 relaxase domain-containing protein [Rathayibacter rathayi NCPPB 2980 = VKM Ac-1601]SOE05907.1 conjugative relaxase domain-containing protein, TrwC/TraI family [Rathayibacter rathayi NCPPB 2980 = VKM Ac-1601]